MSDRPRFRISTEPRGSRSPHLVLLRKAISFAVIGLVNTGVDAGIFFLAYHVLTGFAAVMRASGQLASLCACGAATDPVLVLSNVISWFVAVSLSYVMNSHITFAAESGGRLTRRGYGLFVGAGIIGMIANTVTLVVAARYLPVWGAKFCAILVSFIVNFSTSHFVVFRPRRGNGEPAA